MSDTLHTWFEAKIRYEKVAENGMTKKVTEPYLIEALSFTEAESRIIEELVPYISGEFAVSGIKRANYSEVFTSDKEEDDRWFKCKINFITLDEKSGAEKKVASYMLVQAADLRVAVKNLDESMKGTMADYEIASIAETAIMDVYPYESKQESDQYHGVTHEDVEKTPSVSALIDECPVGKTMTVNIGNREVTVDRTNPDNTVVRPMAATGN